MREFGKAIEGMCNYTIIVTVDSPISTNISLCGSFDSRVYMYDIFISSRIFASLDPIQINPQSLYENFHDLGDQDSHKSHCQTLECFASVCPTRHEGRITYGVS